MRDEVAPAFRLVVPQGSAHKRENKNIKNRVLNKKERIETLKTVFCSMFCREGIGFELDLLSGFPQLLFPAEGLNFDTKGLKVKVWRGLTVSVFGFRVRG